MKKTYLKIAAAIGLLGVSAAAMAANLDCCVSLDCCLEMLACCF